MKNKNKPLVYGLLISAGFGFLIYQSVSNRGLGANFSPRSQHGGSAQALGSNRLADSSTSADLAPDFTLDRFGGGVISLVDYRGVKPVVLDFWASWCHNCERDMPKLSKMYDKYKDQVEVIGVNLREKNNAIEKFVNKHDINFPIALDPGTVARQYNIRYTNHHVLIDKEGKMVKVVPGDLSERDFKSLF